MIIRRAKAHWEGSGKEGNGDITTTSKNLNHAKYSYTSRFEEGIGTNPEELIAAAHAGCFTMKVAFNISGAGFTATELETNCEISFDNGIITKSHLILHAKVEGISDEKFAELVNDARDNCPVSKLLKAEISAEHTLNK